jgi:O-antigen/teichoic acid export membrane protein
MITTRTSRAIAGTITSFLQYALLIVLQFILAPVVLRVSGQEVLGAYSFLMQIISWAVLTDLGFGVATGRYLAQAHGIDDERKRFCAIFTTSRTFYLGSNIAFALLILIVGWKVGSLMLMSPGVESQARLSLYLLATWVAIRVPVSLYGDALIATQNLAAVNMIVALGNVLRLLLSLLMVVLGAGLIGLMTANIVAEATTFIVERAWYRKLYPSDKFSWGISDRALFREMLGFGVLYMVMIVAHRLSASTDSIIVGYLHGAAMVSIYYTSQMPGTLLYQLIWKLTDNSAPAVNELYAKRAISQLTSAYLRLLRYSLLLAIPLAIGLLGLNRYAIKLWVGQAQYAGFLLSAALAVFAITQVTIHLNAIVMVAYGDVRVMSIFSLCAGIVKVILAFWLGRTIGLAGVMIANALVDMPGLVYFCYRVWRLLGVPIPQAWRHAVVPALRANILTLLVLIVLLIQPPAMTWLWFLLWVSIFALAWAVGTGGIGLLPTERDQMRLYVKRMLTLAFSKTSSL